MKVQARWVLHCLTGAAMVVFAPRELSSQAPYKYEVVSIHLAEPGQMNSGFSPGPQGGMRARNVTALQTMAFAYSLQDYQIVGVPAWAKSERFEISFTADRSEIVPGRETPRAVMDGWLERQRQRMRAVLHDRFTLESHTETRELPMYVLTAAKGGHKLQAPAHPERTQTMNINNGQHLIATTAPVKALTDALSMILSHPVRDETGVQGTFDFKMDWSPDPAIQATRAAGAPEDAADRGSIFTALTEQLGLRLESKKGPSPVLVIDKLERPSEN